jgi:hypothetical protein
LKSPYADAEERRELHLREAILSADRSDIGTTEIRLAGCGPIPPEDGSTLFHALDEFLEQFVLHLNSSRTRAASIARRGHLIARRLTGLANRVAGRLLKRVG